MSPLWNPARMARESGQRPGSGALGHFVCVDGFGPVSEEERAAGMPGHGEAAKQPWEITAYNQNGPATSISFAARLPLVEEMFRRTLRIVDGENVIYVESELENLLAFDRPVCWAEHATIGSPFLEPVQTAVDMPAVRARTRPHPSKPDRLPQRLASNAEFTWPLAPLLAGGYTDLRTAPDPPNSLDHATCLLDPSRPLVWVTALQLEKRLLLGYVFRQSEYPWLQTWDNYPPNRRMSRGIEFSTQPFDVPRREAIDTRSMFGAPTYRWLPAKSRIGSRFLLFYTAVPEGFRKVDEVRMEKGRILIEDRKAGKTVTLAASMWSTL